MPLKKFPAVRTSDTLSIKLISCHNNLTWKLPVFKANPVGTISGSRIARPGDGGADKVNGEAVVVRRADLIRSGYRIEHQGVATINVLEMKSGYIIKHVSEKSYFEVTLHREVFF